MKQVSLIHVVRNILHAARNCYFTIFNETHKIRCGLIRSTLNDHNYNLPMSMSESGLK